MQNPALVGGLGVRKSFIFIGMVIAGCFSVCGTSLAGEIRVGVKAHDIGIFGAGGLKGKEESIAISGEYIFESPEILSWALKPKPFIGGTVNLEGETSFGGAGLLWRAGFFENLYGELAFGAVVHDGTLEVPNPTLESTFEEILVLQERELNEIEFGSRVLFRTALAIGYRFNDNWAADIVYEHLSHGNILSSGSNEGLDNIGLRVSRRF